MILIVDASEIKVPLIDTTLRNLYPTDAYDAALSSDFVFCTEDGQAKCLKTADQGLIPVHKIFPARLIAARIIRASRWRREQQQT
jgi:hypothetical protein